MRYLDFEKPLEEIEAKLIEVEAYANASEIDLNNEIQSLRQRLDRTFDEIFSSLQPWQHIQLARHPDRPYFRDYLPHLFTEWQELRGDRLYGDDRALITGLAKLNGTSVAICAHQKGRNTEENLRRNFGMPHPEGFRKAQRIMELAGRLGLPIITFIDSAGAYPGLGAEERGQHEAIARNLLVMSRLPVPIICIVTGEGGSGGALAIAVGNRVVMLEYSYYAVCTPEACAAIIYKDRTRAAEVTECMRIIASDLHQLGLVDRIIPEARGGAHRDAAITGANIKQALTEELELLQRMSKEEIVQDRYDRFRKMGVFETADA